MTTTNEIEKQLRMQDVSIRALEETADALRADIERLTRETNITAEIVLKLVNGELPRRRRQSR